LLSLATIGERMSSQPEKREIPVARTGLDRADVKLSLDALHLLADADRVAVDVRPAQAQNLTAPQPVEQQQHERGMKRIISRRGEERQSLSIGPRDHLSGFPGGQLDQAGHVARN
jgi:hypothetical protein